MAGPRRRAWAWVLAIDRFVRLHLLFFSALWLILGVTSVRRHLAIAELAGLLLVMVCFHIYAYVFNDVVDLPIDRTEPAREHDPLVRGAIQPGQALLIALIQPVLCVPLTMWLGGTTGAHATLGAGLGLMGVYNLWGKRCAFPPLTDAIQGLAWGSLAVYSPRALGDEPNALTWIIAAYAVVVTVYINGIHGGLRDLANDVSSGARTTAIFLGARPAAGGRYPEVPTLMTLYASFLLGMLVVMSTVLAFWMVPGYGRMSGVLTVLAVGVLNLGAVAVHPSVVRPREQEWNLALRLQLYLVVLSLPATLVASMSAAVLAVWLILQVIGLILFECTTAVVRWVWLTIRFVLAARNEKELA